jgi:GNAT superfamily N-acetyltransferase
MAGRPKQREEAGGEPAGQPADSFERTGQAMVTPPDAAREAASVSTVSEAGRPGAIRALAEAFYDDPLFTWICPDASRRLRKLERGFGLFGDRVWFRHELVFSTPQAAGAAVWLPPQEWHVGTASQLRMLPRMLGILGPSDLLRLMRLLNLAEGHHPHEPHYYLPVIGVRRSWQGRGLGTALLQAMLGRCDRERMPAYLEATSPRNRACYERNGFEVTDELTPKGGPPFWPMWRKPQPA